MNATDRALLLLAETEMHKLAKPKSKEYERWQNIKRGRARFGIEEAEALAELFPEYALWLITGRTNPEAGQISPEIAKTAEDYRQTGTDTE